MFASKKLIVFSLTLLTIVYLSYLNFNLPFMTIDELNSVIKSFNYQFNENLTTGRVSHFFAMPTHQLLSFNAPHFLDLIPRFLSLIILYLALIVYLNKLLNDIFKAIIFSSLVILTSQIDWQHNSMVAFFGSYNIYISAFILAIVLLEENIEGRARFEVIRALIIYTLLMLSYASEVFFGLSIIYLLIMLILLPERSLKLLPVIFSIATYILFFLFSRPYIHDGPSVRMQHYLLGSVVEYGLFDVFKGFLLYFINSIPYYNKVNFSQFNSLLISIFFIIVFIFLVIKKIFFSGRQKTFIVANVVVLFFLMTVPHLLISFQPMKLNWILNGQSERYVFSNYSWMAFFILSLLLINFKFFKSRFKTVSIVFLVTFSAIIVVYNLKFTENYEVSLKNWKTIGEGFDNEQGVVKFSPNLLSDHPFVSPVTKEYIKLYGKALHNKKVFVCSDHSYLEFSSPVTDKVKLNGFYNIENQGRWTKGLTASVEYPIDFRKNMSFKFEVSQVIGNNKFYPIIFEIGGYHYSHTFNKELDVVFTLEDDPLNASINIFVPEPVQPKKLGMNSDEREVGIMMKSISIGTQYNETFILDKFENCE